MQREQEGSKLGFVEMPLKPIGTALALKDSMTTTNSNQATETNCYVARSINFDWHEPLTNETFAGVLAAAKSRGFEAAIYAANELIATWSPLYGLRMHG